MIVNRKNVIIGVALTAVMACALAVAQNDNGSEKELFKGKAAMIASALDLTTEQQMEIASILKKHRGEAEPLVDAYLLARRVLRDATLDGAPEVEIRELATTVAEMEVELAVLKAQVATEVKETLDDKQERKVRDWLGMMDEKVDHAHAEFVKSLEAF